MVEKYGRDDVITSCFAGAARSGQPCPVPRAATCPSRSAPVTNIVLHGSVGGALQIVSASMCSFAVGCRGTLGGVGR